MINTKNEMRIWKIEYLKNMEYELIDMLSTPGIIRKTSNNNYKDYVDKNLNKDLPSGDTIHAESTLSSFKFKKVRKNKNWGTIRRWWRKNCRFIRQATTRARWRRSKRRERIKNLEFEETTIQTSSIITMITRRN